MSHAVLATLAPGAVLAMIAACSSPRGPAAPAVDPDRIAIVASERGPHGTRLVAIDEHGDRRFELVAAATSTVRDANPAISPDGAWMVFVSTRGRPLDRTSLWIAPLGAEATPARLTDPGATDAIDSHPTWTPDGRAIVFASTRDGGDFDLWRLPIDRGRAAGAPVQLTTAPSHEVTPTIAPGGAIIYAAVTPTGGNEVESRLEQRAPDGTVRRLTDGPGDSSPACSPDGATLVFARPRVHDGVADAELWRSSLDSWDASLIVELPLTDEGGPVWSRDGRYVFATSIYRNAEGKPMFSSVVHVDMQESPRRARILRDRAGPNVRLTPAVAIDRLDGPALRSDPEYVPELARIMTALVERAMQENQ